MKTIIANKSDLAYTSKVIDGVTHIIITEDIAIDKNNFEQRVKVALLLTGKSQYEICKKLAISPAAFLSKCRNGKVNFDEQKTIADAIGCGIEIKFVFPDNAEIKGDNARELVSLACEYAGITMMELSERLSMSRQNFSGILLNNKLNFEGFQNIAAALGCEYVNYFKLDDGTRI